MYSKTCKFISVFFFLLFAIVTSGQDYHYWSEQYGGEASLLGGAALAGMGDNSSVFYNPAAMAFQHYTEKLSISANAYRLRYVTMKHGLGPERHINNFNMMINPQLIAGMINFKKAPRFHLSYALLTKNSYHFKVNTQATFIDDILSSEVGDEYFVGNYEFENSLLDQWAGFGIAYQLSDHFSIGLSHFGIYRNYKYHNNIELSAFPLDTAYHHISEFRSSINFDYWNLTGIFKLGLILNYEKITIGLTGTSPTFGIAGSANAQRIFKIVNLDFVTNNDFAVIDRKEGMKTHHKYPGSIGVGINYTMSSKLATYFSYEYFFSFDEYYVFSSTDNPVSYPELTEPEIEHIFGDAPFISFIESSKSVMNFGLGIRYKWNDKLSVLSGFRTDFNHNALGNFEMGRVVAESVNWDIYHFSLGVRKEGKKALTTGVEFSFAPETKTNAFVNLSDPDENNTLLGDNQIGTTAKQFGLKLIISYTIHSD